MIPMPKPDPWAQPSAKLGNGTKPGPDLCVAASCSNCADIWVRRGIRWSVTCVLRHISGTQGRHVALGAIRDA
jgi:hypothetical protein